MNLEARCKLKGVEYKDFGNGHIQLIGPLTVDYYPYSKKKSAYVIGTKKSLRHVTPDKALRMCFEAPKAIGAICKRKYNSRRIRKALLKKVTNCHWCSEPLTLDTSTLEHIIPLARGGLENANNRTLACLECNHSRGSEMPELKSE